MFIKIMSIILITAGRCAVPASQPARLSIVIPYNIIARRCDTVFQLHAARRENSEIQD